MKALSLVLAALALFGPAPVYGGAQVEAYRADVAVNGWSAKKADCICGISDAAKISNPAKVDYDTLLSATPQMKEMKRKRIDPQSREGRALKSKAKTLVARTCKSVQKTKGHCGVWKKISHKDKRKIADITADVEAAF